MPSNFIVVVANYHLAVTRGNKRWRTIFQITIKFTILACLIHTTTTIAPYSQQQFCNHSCKLVAVTANYFKAILFGQLWERPRNDSNVVLCCNSSIQKQSDGSRSFLKKNGPLFSLFSSFLGFTWQIITFEHKFNIADVGIRITDLCCRMQPLCQLRHNHGQRYP